MEPKVKTLKKIPRASSKTQKNPWTKHLPPKSPMAILWPLKVPEGGNAVKLVFAYSSYYLNISFPSSGSHFNKLEQVLETPKNGIAGHHGTMQTTDNTCDVK